MTHDLKSANDDPCARKFYDLVVCVNIFHGTLHTPVSLTHAYPPHTSPHASPRKKMLRGDAWGRPHEFPTQNVDFFHPHKRALVDYSSKLSSPRNPHAILVNVYPKIDNPRAIYIWKLCSPHKKGSAQHPHAKCDVRYPSPRKILSWCGSVRQGCFNSSRYGWKSDHGSILIINRLEISRILVYKSLCFEEIIFSLN